MLTGEAVNIETDIHSALMRLRHPKDIMAVGCQRIQRQCDHWHPITVCKCQIGSWRIRRENVVIDAAGCPSVSDDADLQMPAAL
jgi:hypothetical protein